MKKFFLMLAIAGVSVASMAQEADPTEKYSVSTNSFWSNWFIQVNAVGTSFFDNGEKWGSPFKDYRTNLGASVAIGKWFTPGIGLRTKVTGIWGRDILGTDKTQNAMKYWQANEQVLLNLSNMLCGYNETRVWNFIPYFGGGLARNMSWDQYSFGLNFGILNTWRLSKRVRVNLDLSLGTHEVDFVAGSNNEKNLKRYLLENKDRDLNVEIGLTFNLGKGTWNKTPDVEAIKALSQGQIDALNAQLSDAQAENARLKDLLANQPKPAETNAVATQTVTKVVAAPVSVFFNIGKDKVASKKDLQNVSDLAKVAKDNNSKIVVTGYADSKTGSAEYNKALSERRANRVVDELVNMGVNRDQIEVVAAGGVADLTPISYNRRATVEIK